MCVGQRHAAFADSVRRAANIPEFSYAVVTAKVVEELATSGRHSVALPDAATLNDRFHLGSNTKALTGFVAAHCVEQKRLRWDTRLFDLFPAWQATARPAYQPITLLDLLTHRAGILPFQGDNDPPIPTFPAGSRQERRRAFGQWVLTLEPAKLDAEHPFVYSNAGYTLAALLLEQATGRSWEALVEEVLNHDLHLDARFGWPENQTHPDTWGHSFEDGKLVPVPSTTDYHLDFTEPAGDLNLTLPAYLRFVQLNLRGLHGRRAYLRPATYQVLHRALPAYAVGWYNVVETDADYSTHSGTAGTYYTLTAIDRRHGRAYIVFTNSFNDATVGAVRTLMRKLKRTYGG